MRAHGREGPEELLRAMLGIPSVSGDEGRLAAFLADRMALLGLEAHVDAAGNAHGVAGPAEAPTVMLLGHIDTVPGVVPVCRVGDLLYGRGAVDAKGPMAAMVHAAARIARSGADVRVHVVGAVGEEVAGSRGTRHVMATTPRPDAVIVGEPSGWDGVCIGYKGRIGVRYRVAKPPLHTSSPEPTAVETAAGFARWVQEYLASVSDSDDPVSFGAATGTLTRLHGDLSRAEAFLTCRVPPGFDFAAFEEHVHAYGAGAVDFDEQVPAVRTARGDAVVSALRAAIREGGGLPSLKLKAGTADLNVVAEWGVPMAAYGPGDSHLDHTSDEHIPIPDLTRAVDVLAAALPRLGGRLRAASHAPAATG